MTEAANPPAARAGAKALTNSSTMPLTLGGGTWGEAIGDCCGGACKSGCEWKEDPLRPRREC